MKRNILVLLLSLTSSIHTTLAQHTPGQHFILALPETYDHKKLSSWLDKTRPAGVMLLSYHCTNRQKTKNLISHLQREAKKLGIPPLFVSIDWEGGIVSRPNEEGGFHSAPSPWALSQAGLPACFLGGMLIGQQARSIGVNVCFAPLLDLFDQNNHILGTRCFSDNPDIVAECGIAFAHGLMSQGVLPVIKHFPGLGLGTGDTHHVDVTIKADNTLWAHHTKPFLQALNAGLPLIMATHATFQQCDNQPATLSHTAVGMIKKASPSSLLITDDFCMKAVTKNRTVIDAALKALNAGYHAIIFSGKPNEQIELMESLQEAFVKMPQKQNLAIKTRHNAIIACKKKYFSHEAQYFPLCNEHQTASFLAHRCLLQQKIYTPEQFKKATLITVDLPRIRPPEKWFIAHHQSYLCKKLTEHGIAVREVILDAKNNTSIDELKKIIDQYDPEDNGPLLVQSFFYANDIWNANQKKWYKLLTPLQKNIIVISLGHPYEKHLLPEAQILTIGSFHKPLLNTVAEKLCIQHERTGAHKLLEHCERYLQGKRFGLLCHRCSIVSYHNHDIFLPDALFNWARDQRDGTRLSALFCPEHGLLGNVEAGGKVSSHDQSRWGCPIHSLHGAVKKPTPEMLQNLDILIIDLQEVGVRCFTYISTLKLVLEAAALSEVQVIVLDRPNPLLLLGPQGPRMEKQYESFLGAINTPFLHGRSIGAIAKNINQEIGARLTILDCDTAHKRLLPHEPFTAPSPNLCSIDHVFAYPMTVFLEGTNYSEGRGTAYPFLQFGAPWVDKKILSDALNKKCLPGVYFEPVTFTPKKIPGVAETPKHRNVLCHGVFVHVYDHETLRPVLVAKTILDVLFFLYKDKSHLLQYSNRYVLDSLIGSNSWRLHLQGENQNNQ